MSPGGLGRSSIGQSAPRDFFVTIYKDSGSRLCPRRIYGSGFLSRCCGVTASAFGLQIPPFYPNGRPANVDDTSYWARVKFGLKPTLRIVQMVTLRGAPSDPVACAVAEKQLYSSHYFETALDLSFCVRDPGQPGFYLIMAMGSEQAGLTGVKGPIVREAAVGRSVSNLQSALTTIKGTLESN